MKSINNCRHTFTTPAPNKIPEEKFTYDINKDLFLEEKKTLLTCYILQWIALLFCMLLQARKTIYNHHKNPTVILVENKLHSSNFRSWDNSHKQKGYFLLTTLLKDREATVEAEKKQYWSHH